MSSLMEIEEQIYTHEYLWRSSSRLLEQAEASEDVSFYFLLPSLLMSFMAFEAFVNFCGFVVLPELWAEEKKNFKGKGIEGKLGAIVAKLPSFDWRKGEAPYQNIRNLEDFRDIVAHGSSYTIRCRTEERRNAFPIPAFMGHLSFNTVCKKRPSRHQVLFAKPFG